MTKEQQEKVLENMNLVHYILTKKVKVDRDASYYDDLYQDGLLLLCYLVQRFDESQGVKFSTYAGASLELHLRSRVREYYRTLFGKSRTHSDLISKITSYRYDNPSATDEELCKALDCTLSDLKEVYDYYNTLSLDVEVLPDSGISLEESIPSSEDTLRDAEMICRQVLGQIKYNSERDKMMFTEKVLGDLYGKITDVELGHKYGISKQRVNSLCKKYSARFQELLPREDLLK